MNDGSARHGPLSVNPPVEDQTVDEGGPAAAPGPAERLALLTKAYLFGITPLKAA